MRGRVTGALWDIQELIIRSEVKRLLLSKSPFLKHKCYLSSAGSDLVKALVTIPKSVLSMVSARTALLFLLPQAACPLELVM